MFTTNILNIMDHLIIKMFKEISMKRLTNYNKMVPLKRYHFIDDEDELDNNINQLPPNIRNKIYIISMRNYWREYIPETAKVPIWYEHAVNQRQLLFDAMQKNIHFMHLPCNTLDSNKKYILGCQCSFCEFYGYGEDLEGKKIRKEKEKKYLEGGSYEKIFTNSKWYDNYEYYITDDDVKTGMKLFNPSEDIIFTLKDIIEGDPINFIQSNY